MTTSGDDDKKQLGQKPKDRMVRFTIMSLDDTDALMGHFNQKPSGLLPMVDGSASDPATNEYRRQGSLALRKWLVEYRSVYEAAGYDLAALDELAKTD